MRLDERTVAVVTGAAGGIGRATALELSLVDVDEAGLEKTKDLTSRGAPEISLHPTDVSDRVAMEALPEIVIRHHRDVHLLVNNAGVSVAAPLDEMKLDDFDWLMGVNLCGVVHGCHFFLPHLRRAERSHICNVLSDFALIGFPTKSAYCASKFAVRGFSEAIRAELFGTAVGLTTVYPGPVDTGLIRHGRTWDESKRAAEAEFVTSRGLPPETVAKRICRGIERNRKRVLIGKETHLIDLMTRAFPTLSATLAGRMRDRFPFL
jgi:short-subunit dehydrogenase